MESLLITAGVGSMAPPENEELLLSSSGQRSDGRLTSQGERLLSNRIERQPAQNFTATEVWFKVDRCRLTIIPLKRPVNHSTAELQFNVQGPFGSDEARTVLQRSFCAPFGPGCFEIELYQAASSIGGTWRSARQFFARYEGRAFSASDQWSALSVRHTPHTDIVIACFSVRFEDGFLNQFRQIVSWGCVFAQG